MSEEDRKKRVLTMTFFAGQQDWLCRPYRNQWIFLAEHCCQVCAEYLQVALVYKFVLPLQPDNCSISLFVYYLPPSNRKDLPGLYYHRLRAIPIEPAMCTLEQEQVCTTTRHTNFDASCSTILYGNAWLVGFVHISSKPRCCKWHLL